jgi:hypothetical protein
MVNWTDGNKTCQQNCHSGALVRAVVVAVSSNSRGQTKSGSRVWRENGILV